MPIPFDGVADDLDYGATIAGALRRELGQTHQAIKTIMAWSNASERTVKNWLTGATGPSGVHLACLARNSDAVFEVFLQMAGRERAISGARMVAFRAALENLLPHLDEVAE